MHGLSDKWDAQQCNIEKHVTMWPHVGTNWSDHYLTWHIPCTRIALLFLAPGKLSAIFFHLFYQHFE